MHMKRYHFKTRINQIKPEKPKASKECSQCSKKFQHYRSLHKHAKLRHNREQFTCGICPKVEETESGMKQHIKHYHTDDKCLVCGIVLPKIEMRKHKKNRHQDRSHQVGGNCGLCQRFYPSSSGLRHHTKKCQNLQDMLKQEN